MTFLTPLFLGGLGFALLPVLIHLLTRRARVRQVLPTMRFIRQVEATTRQRRRLRDLLLLALRVMILALLALAFARPGFELADGGAAGARPQVVVLIDRSGSMNYIVDGEPLLARARREAERIIRSAPGDAEITVIAFAAQPEVVADGIGAAEAREAVARIAATCQPTDALAALRRAAEVTGPREVFFISDLAAHGFSGGAAPELAVLTADLQFIDLSGSGHWNRWLAGIEWTGEKDAARVSLRLGESGDPDSGAEVGVSLPEAAFSAALNPGQMAAGLAEFAVPGFPARGRLELTADPLPDDNRRYYATGNPVRFRAGYPDETRGAAYLTAVGDPACWTAVRAAGELARVRTLVLGRGGAAAEWGAQLREFVGQGGTLVVCAAALEENAELNKQLTGLLPIVPGEPRSYAPGYSLQPNLSLPAFGAGWPVALLARQRVRRYLDATPEFSASVLIRMANGVPWLSARSVGRGTVYFWNIAIDGTWSDIPTTPLFPIMVHSFVTTGAGGAAAAVGDELVFPTDLPDSAAVTANGPDGRRQRGTVVAGEARFGPAERPGFYEFDGLTKTVNFPARESDITPLPPDDAARLLGGQSATVESSGATVEHPLGKPGARRDEWWRTALLALLALALVELYVSRRPASVRS